MTEKPSEGMLSVQVRREVLSTAGLWRGYACELACVCAYVCVCLMGYLDLLSTPLHLPPTTLPFS